MAYGNALKFKANPLLALDFDEFPVDDSYELVGTLPNIVRLIRIQNLTDVTIVFSFDGVNDHEVLVTQSFLLLDISSNQSEMGGLYIAAGQPIYARYQDATNPTLGEVVVSSFYGYNGE